MRGVGLISWFTEDLPIQERFQLIKEAGFEATELWWVDEDRHTWPDMARKTGLQVDNIHAPIGEPDHLWREGIDGEAYQNMLLSCVEDCARHGIPTVVVHISAFGQGMGVTELGLARIGKIIDAAERKNIKLAFENLTVLEHLDAVFARFPSPNVGFCWDSGHENCYHPHKDCLALYGDKLFAVHMNDNRGDGDSHMLPFDGTVDWAVQTPKLNQCREIEYLSIESGVKCGYRGRKLYGNLSAREYVALAYQRAMELFDMLRG